MPTTRIAFAITDRLPGRRFDRDPRRGCNPDRVDPDRFFRGGAAEQLQVVKEFCRPCPVRRACLDWAVDTGQSEGVWGGLTVRQLRAEVRRRGRPS